MSFEGYYQCLCKNGHLSTYDVYDYRAPDNDYGCVPRQWHCRCGASLVWRHTVDETNCDPHPIELEVAHEAVLEKCATCGHVKQVEEVRYKIPKASSFSTITFNYD